MKQDTKMLIISVYGGNFYDATIHEFPHPRAAREWLATQPPPDKRQEYIRIGLTALAVMAYYTADYLADGHTGIWEDAA